MEIEIRGEGELVMRFIDRTGQTLMQERLTVSGSPKMTALRMVDLALRTTDGDAAVAPVLVSQTNAAQRVRFDGATPAQFTRRRCKEIGCDAKVTAAAARGVVPAPVAGDRPFMRSDEAVLTKLLKAAAR
jgi:hypothetical protein